ncbi:type II secretion system protein [Sporosarcina sp. 179-K 3D1 HS]|uniref:prepilin-type N-terminal cleavage/methylation domain-containing protein n=1 Tax=Sporosarcina sp. 179-K 3D1 HS TaxID=3232169 RepID=UPI0039A0967C
MRNSESGFTFLEMLLVLSIMAILTVIILPVGDRWIKETTEQEALQAFVVAIYDLQAYSMAHNIATRLEFKNAGTEYITYASARELARSSFPEGMRYESSAVTKIEFQGNGDIKKSGTATVFAKRGNFDIRFQFLRGRVIVYE